MFASSRGIDTKYIINYSYMTVNYAILLTAVVDSPYPTGNGQEGKENKFSECRNLNREK